METVELVIPLCPQCGRRTNKQERYYTSRTSKEGPYRNEPLEVLQRMEDFQHLSLWERKEYNFREAAGENPRAILDDIISRSLTVPESRIYYEKAVEGAQTPLTSEVSKALVREILSQRDPKVMGRLFLFRPKCCRKEFFQPQVFYSQRNRPIIITGTTSREDYQNLLPEIANEKGMTPIARALKAPPDYSMGIVDTSTPMSTDWIGDDDLVPTTKPAVSQPPPVISKRNLKRRPVVVAESTKPISVPIIVPDISAESIPGMEETLKRLSSLGVGIKPATTAPVEERYQTAGPGAAAAMFRGTKTFSAI